MYTWATIAMSACANFEIKRAINSGRNKRKNVVSTRFCCSKNMLNSFVGTTKCNNKHLIMPYDTGYDKLNCTHTEKNCYKTHLSFSVPKIDAKYSAIFPAYRTPLAQNTNSTFVYWNCCNRAVCSTKLIKKWVWSVCEDDDGLCMLFSRFCSPLILNFSMSQTYVNMAVKPLWYEVVCISFVVWNCVLVFLCSAFDNFFKTMNFSLLF